HHQWVPPLGRLRQYAAGHRGDRRAARAFPAAPPRRGRRRGLARTFRSRPVIRLGNVTFDCADPARLAQFWASATDYQITESNPFMVRLIPPGGGRPHLLMIKVPEGKTARNRVHLEQ